MKNFTYRSLDEKDNIEAVLKQRKKKINRQQIIAGIIIFFIVSIATLYAIDRSFYTQYDAYIHIETNKVRAPYDIYLDSVYVQPGDIVHVGDTLYSYYVLDWLVLEVNPNDEPSVLQNRRTLTLQLSDIEQKIRVLEVRIAELRKQIALESHNISFGLSDNSHKMDLERELKESEALLRALRAQLAVIAGLKNDAEFGPRGTNRARKGGTQIYENPYSKSDSYQIRYNISNKDGFITNVYAPIGMIFFEKEEIIDMQHLDLKDNNLMIVAYVPVNLTSRIKDNMPAKVYVNDELNFDAHVVMTGVRSEDIPESLRSYFTKANVALIAVLTIDEGQTIPFWSATSGLPVQVKIRNLFPWEEEPVVQRTMLYEVGKGLLIKDADGTVISAEDLGKAKKAHADSVKKADMRNRMYDNNSPAAPEADKANGNATAKNQATAQDKKQPAKTSDKQSAATTKEQNKTTQKNQDKANSATNGKKAAKADMPAVTPSTKAKGRFIVVAGVFSSEDRAQAYAKEIKADGHKNTAMLSHGNSRYVYLSAFDLEKDANAEAARIKKTGTKYNGVWVFDTNKLKKK